LGISSNRNAIVGYDLRNGKQEAFVATIPEPTSLGLIVFAATGLTLARRRPTSCFRSSRLCRRRPADASSCS
jgi:hypothetical protein